MRTEFKFERQKAAVCKIILEAVNRCQMYRERVGRDAVFPANCERTGPDSMLGDEQRSQVQDFLFRCIKTVLVFSIEIHPAIQTPYLENTAQRFFNMFLLSV